MFKQFVLVAAIVVVAAAFPSRLPKVKASVTFDSNGLPDCVDCPEYAQLSAADKMKVLWDNKVLKSVYQSLPEISGSLSAVKLFWEDMNEPFDRFSDQLPEGRDKLIHSFGSIAKVRIVSSGNHPFSGLFKGATNGLARLSLAAPPSLAGFTPGIALKFLRDGQPSSNVIAMWALTGQGKDYNFMLNEMRNFVDEPTGSIPLSLLAKAFAKGAEEPVHITADGMAAEEGLDDPNIVAPHELFFKPVRTFSSDPSHDFRNDLAGLKAGDVLYEIYGTTSPCRCGQGLSTGLPCPSHDKCGASAVKIGTLVLDSPFVASEYSDKYMFFQHYRFVKKDVQRCVEDSGDFGDGESNRYAADHREICSASGCPSGTTSAGSGCPYLAARAATMDSTVSEELQM